MTWLEKTTLTCEPTVLFYHAKADYCRQGNIPLCSRQK
jgi:hypothetical protein